ncbi:hypothetical protein TH53_05875 [Pedobacter lusitanus]|uniref:Fimbrial assembly family protein n=1 Tax=Pedobacter lusitanus TaxID=1503925 RepID=A0A0D0GU76_9SPHI|nr:PilN domain-containing protein [Pedobacter lusitanus]KIO77966.1 hypothetical protein TH53_05875 [Pedobacter lusitanus]
MMLSSELTTSLGIELKWLTDTTFSCRFCVLTKNKNSLTITSKKVVEGSLSTVIESLPRNYPVALTLSGKGTLHKVIHTENDPDAAQVLKNAFPGVEENDFHCQVFTDEGVSLVSIVRKSITDPLLDKLERAGIKIYNLTVGAGVTTHIWPQLSIRHKEMRFDGHMFTLSESKTLLNYSASPEFKHELPVKIGDEAIAENMIVAYAAAFQLMLHDRLSVIAANTETVQAAFEKFLEQAKLKKQLLVMTFGLFFLLLISFLLFSYYNAENSRLVREVGTQTASADHTELLQRHIAENEYLMKRLGWNGGYNYGYLLNELGSSAPNRLVLTNVLMNDYKTDQEKQLMEPNIRIKGTTDNLAAVNNWIFILKEKPWVKTVRLVQYQQEAESELYEFNLLLTY